MTDEEFVDFCEQAKKELKKLDDQGAFNPLIKLLDERFRNETRLSKVFRIQMYGELVSANETKDSNARKIIPLCFIDVGKTLDVKYAGINFGIVPKLPPGMGLKLQVTKRA